jgi:hypothetical protein
MKWLILIALTLTLLASAKPKCELSIFYNIAYTVHNPTARHDAMLKWLNVNASDCSKQDLTNLWNRLPELAGNADSFELRQKILGAYEKK